MKLHEQALILLRKASQDEALLDEVLDSPSVSDEIIGFHCQQAAEKLLKAVLAEFGVHFHRTHNLRQLMDVLADEGRSVPDDLQDLDALTPFGAIFRYEFPPFPVHLDRKSARGMIRRLREWARAQVPE